MVIEYMKLTRNRARINEQHCYYRNGMASGAHIMQLMEDAAMELSIMDSGDEGLLAGYERVEFYHSLYSGDYVEVAAWFSKIGNKSRRVELEVYKVIEAVQGSDSASNILESPLLVARATLIGVLPKGRDRGMQVKEKDYPFIDANGENWWEEKNE